MKLTDNLRSYYLKQWRALTIRDAWVPSVSSAVNRIARGRDRYGSLEQQSGVPWYVIAVIHELESGCDFATHLHNGDPLTLRTRNDPRNRPPAGTPPFAFDVSALDALAYDHLSDWKDWSLSGISYKLEGYNGWGYQGRGVPSPYLYSGSDRYTRGKYVADGVYDSKRVSKQVGALTILKALANAGAITIEER